MDWKRGGVVVPVNGTRKGDTRRKRELPLSSRVSLSRGAPFFLAPITSKRLLRRSSTFCQRIIHAFCKLCIRVVSCSHWSSLNALSGVVQCTNSKRSDHTILQVDDYKRLKTMENYKTVRTKCGCACLWQNYDKALHRKMVFLIGGRLREMVTHERWSHMEVWLWFILKSFIQDVQSSRKCRVGKR